MAEWVAKRLGSDGLDESQKDPVNYLNLQPLIRFQRDEGRTIQRGELLDAYPMFCMAESANGVSLKAVPALQRISFLAHVAAQISKLPEGAKISFKFVDWPRVRASGTDQPR